MGNGNKQRKEGADFSDTAEGDWTGKGGVEVFGALCEIRSCPGATTNSWEVAFPQASSWE